MSERTRGAGPPEHDPVNIQIVTVPDSGTLTVRFLGSVTGIWTHWRGKSSVACSGEKLCKAEWHRERTIWKGYAAVEWLKAASQPTWIPAVLEVTEGLMEYLQAECLRGQKWRLCRAAVGGRRSECRGTLTGECSKALLRADIDVELAVKRLYRSLWVEFGKDPPFGARQRLMPTTAGDEGTTTARVPLHLDSAEEREKKRRIIAAALKGDGNTNGNRK
jgi:hypothetical protein